MAKQGSKKKKETKTPREIVHRHLQDQKDVISDEDFKNLSIGTDALPANEEPLDIKNNKDRPKDEEKDPSIITPWDIIDE